MPGRRTLTVSMCIWNDATFPSASVQTWTMSNSAGAPVPLWLQLVVPSATTVSPSATTWSMPIEKSSPISPRRMNTPSTMACGPT